MEGARLLSLRLLSLSKQGSDPSTPYYGKALFEMLYLDKRPDKCVAPPQLWVKEIIPFGERDVIYD